MGVLTLNVALAADPTCIDYYTVGDSKCQPAASTPVQAAKNTSQPQLLPPAEAQPTKSEVDKYLDNYGKPPREFVEFYLNPTAENAQKWVGTYQQLIGKGETLSKAWGDAEQLYNKSSSAAAGSAGAAQMPAVPAAPPEPSLGIQANPAANATSVNFGGLTGARQGVAQAGLAGSGSTYKLTYYFSQICPYCARMTPDLAALSKEKEGKLAFTCVDVTPEGPQNHPEPTFITSKLPCQWRLPEAGEVDSQQVRQTPTLLIQKDGSAPLRLSGYVPLEQLRQYF